MTVQLSLHWFRQRASTLPLPLPTASCRPATFSAPGSAGDHCRALGLSIQQHKHCGLVRANFMGNRPSANGVPENSIHANGVPSGCLPGTFYQWSPQRRHAGTPGFGLALPHCRCQRQTHSYGAAGAHHLMADPAIQPGLDRTTVAPLGVP